MVTFSVRTLSVGIPDSCVHFYHSCSSESHWENPSQSDLPAHNCNTLLFLVKAISLLISVVMLETAFPTTSLLSPLQTCTASLPARVKNTMANAQPPHAAWGWWQFVHRWGNPSCQLSASFVASSQLPILSYTLSLSPQHFPGIQKSLLLCHLHSPGYALSPVSRWQSSLGVGMASGFWHHLPTGLFSSLESANHSRR